MSPCVYDADSSLTSFTTVTPSVVVFFLVQVDYRVFWYGKVLPCDFTTEAPVVPFVRYVPAS